MGRQVCDATDSIALYFNVWRHHLPYERGETTEQYDQDFVFSCPEHISLYVSIAQGYGTDHLLLDYPTPRLLLAAPRHRDFGGGIGWVRGSRGQLLLHLRKVLNSCR